MAYLNKITKTKVQPCLCPELPNIEDENLDIGTKWECDTCKKIWATAYKVSSFPEEILTWVDVSGRYHR